MTKTASPTNVMRRAEDRLDGDGDEQLDAGRRGRKRGEGERALVPDESPLREAVAGVVQLSGCSLGRLPPGGSATITIVTQATQPGVVLNVVRVYSEEQESNYANNTAAAVARVTDAHVEAEHVAVLASCRTLIAAPTRLRAGSTSVVLATARNRAGRPIANLPVAARGAGVTHRTKTNAQGVARLTLTPPRQGVVLLSPSARVAAAAGTRCTTRLAVLVGEADSGHRLREPNRYGSRSTTVPRGASRSSRRATPFETRTQPCETASPSRFGWSVPWMPARPPPGQSLSFEYALVTSTNVPKKGSTGTALA